MYASEISVFPLMLGMLMLLVPCIGFTPLMLSYSSSSPSSTSANRPLGRCKGMSSVDDRSDTPAALAISSVASLSSARKSGFIV